MRVKIKPSKWNQRTVFSVENKVLHESQRIFRNSIDWYKVMGYCFKSFFFQKILNAHNGFPSSTLLHCILLEEKSCISKIDKIEPLIEINIRQLLKRSSKAFCAVDLMPTLLVKRCQEVLISSMTNTVNKSLSLGFPKTNENCTYKTINKIPV